MYSGSPKFPGELFKGFQAVWPVKSRQTSLKVAPKIISLQKLKIVTPLQILPKNVRDLGKLIVATGFEKLPKVQ